jgi:hypothetical protein
MSSLVLSAELIEKNPSKLSEVNSRDTKRETATVCGGKVADETTDRDPRVMDKT